ncbi:hypothetical protein AB0K83_39680, partial [Streptomyces sp. NPDC052811]
MVGRGRLGRQFGWLWASYAVSAYGCGLGFGALPLIAVLVLHAGPLRCPRFPRWGHPALRALYLNNMLVSGLIMATEPLLAVLLLRQLGFPPWQYGLAFAAPCLGGLIGSRLAQRVVARYGR